jgi:hypothetical protein
LGPGYSNVTPFSGQKAGVRRHISTIEAGNPSKEGPFAPIIRPRIPLKYGMPDIEKKLLQKYFEMWYNIRSKKEGDKQVVHNKRVVSFCVLPAIPQKILYFPKNEFF